MKVLRFNPTGPFTIFKSLKTRRSDNFIRFRNVVRRGLEALKLWKGRSGNSNTHSHWDDVKKSPFVLLESINRDYDFKTL